MFRKTQPDQTVMNGNNINESVTRINTSTTSYLTIAHTKRMIIV